MRSVNASATAGGSLTGLTEIDLTAPPVIRFILHMKELQ